MSSQVIQEKIKKLFRFLERLWERHSITVCIVLALLISLGHYFGLFVNFRSVTSNVINFSSIVIGVNGVFLTLMVTLQESPVFHRLRDFFPKIQEKLYKSLQWQIYYGLIVVILSIFISILPTSPSKVLSSFGVLVWFTFFWLLTFGAFYTIKLILDLVVKNFDIPERGKRR